MYVILNLSLKVLELLYLLVKYGYYSNLKDVNELIPALISLLNGMNDKPFPDASDEESISFRKVAKCYKKHFMVDTLINITLIGRKTI